MRRLVPLRDLLLFTILVVTDHFWLRWLHARATTPPSPGQVVWLSVGSGAQTQHFQVFMWQAGLHALLVIASLALCVMVVRRWRRLRRTTT